MAHPAGVAVVGLLLALAAGEPHLLGVHDDDEVARVDVGREDGVVLAAQQRRDVRGEAPEHLIVPRPRSTNGSAIARDCANSCVGRGWPGNGRIGSLREAAGLAEGAIGVKPAGGPTPWIRAGKSP